MNELPTPPRRSLRQGDTVDDLGSVPDGYSFAPETQHVGWQSEAPVAATQVDFSSGDPRRSNQASKSAGRAIREILETVLLAAIIFFGVRLLVLNFKVDGQSMLPNLQDNELLLVNRNAYGDIDLNRWLNKVPGVDRDGSWIIWEFDPPERGDIVVFNPPNGDDKPYIKRVLALEGETVEIRDGSVYVDGTEVDEPYIRDGITECFDTEPGGCTWTVPEGHVWVMGDNRRNSSDSRAFGPVSIDSIIGKAIVTYWPVEEIDLVPHYDYPEIED